MIKLDEDARIALSGRIGILSEVRNGKEWFAWHLDNQLNDLPINRQSFPGELEFKFSSREAVFRYAEGFIARELPGLASGAVREAAEGRAYRAYKASQK